MKNNKTQKEVFIYNCAYCNKEISSLSQRQAEYNYNLHRESCIKKRAMEVKKK